MKRRRSVREEWQCGKTKQPAFHRDPTEKLRGRAEALTERRGCKRSSNGIRTPRFLLGETEPRFERFPAYTAAMNIKEMVAEGRKVRFLRYKLGELWYATENGFEFPVPIGDCGDGTFLAEDKAILFMRYIRKHVAYLEDARRAHDQAMEDQPLP